jgi:hypothetical protein
VRDTTGAGEPRTYSAFQGDSSAVVGGGGAYAEDDHHRVGIKDRVKGALHLGKVIEK